VWFADATGAHVDGRVIAISAVIAVLVLTVGAACTMLDSARSAIEIAATGLVTLAVLIPVVVGNVIVSDRADAGDATIVLTLFRRACGMSEVLAFVLGAVGVALGVRHARVLRRPMPALIVTTVFGVGAGTAVAIGSAYAVRSSMAPSGHVDLPVVAAALVLAVLLGVTWLAARRAPGRQSSRLARATSPSHFADGLGERAKFDRSTSTSPKRGTYPNAHSKLSRSDQ
jgi:hypothetical protein